MAEGEEAIGANEARDASGGAVGVGETPKKILSLNSSPAAISVTNDLGPLSSASCQVQF